MLRKVCLGIMLTAFSSAALAATGGITFSSVTHNFGSVTVGQTAQYGVEVTNSSSSAYTFAVDLTSSVFTQTNSCGSSVAAGTSCEIIFTFAPTAAGSDSATWSITSSAPSESPSNGGTLSGTATATAGVTITSSQHNFGGQVQSTSSAAYGVVLSNSTTDPVALNIETEPAEYVDFPISLNNCPATLPANGQCNLQWKFDPASTIAYQTSFAITATDTTTGKAVEIMSGGSTVSGVTVLGTGISAGVTLTTSGRNFGEQAVNSTSQPYGVTLYNGTSGAIQLAFGAVPNGFKLATDTCGSTLAPDASCTGSLEFTPTTTGNFSGTLTVAATSSGSPVPIMSGGQTVSGVTLSGIGATGGLTVTTSAHNFGYFASGQTSPQYGTELTNTGTDTIDLTYTFTSGTDGFNLYSSSCGATLTPSQNCELVFTFAPNANTPMNANQQVYQISGTDTVNNAQVNVVDGTDGAVVSGVTLDGNFVATNGVGLTSTAHDFGEVGVGGAAAEYGVVLYNTGSTAASFTQMYTDTTESSIFALDENNSSCMSETSVPANGSCNLTFNFRPTTSGTFSDTYQITTGSTTLTVSLTGTGVD